MAKTSYQSHITVLESAAALFSSCTAFKIPIYDGCRDIKGWNDVTYKQFYNDVENMAAHWIEKLGLPRNSVVALWLDGISYSDVVAIFSISRAGYVPQLIRLMLESPVLVSEMLVETNAAALINDSSRDISPTQFPVPVHCAVDVKCLLDVPNADILPPLINFRHADDTMMFHYTSGSTSGRPKIVPYSHRWVHGLVRKMTPQTSVGPLRTVTTRIGSMCHLAQLCQLISQFLNGGCQILVPFDFSSNDLIQMVEQCGLTTPSIFSNRLAKHFKNARNDPRLLSVLQSMIQINSGGAAMSKEELDWAYSNGIHIVVSFGLTETGPLLISDNVRGEKPVAYKTLGLEGFHYRFVHVGNSPSLTDEKLLELVVLSESPDCPDVSFRSADGHFHTKDAFIELSPGRYVFRSRLDDRLEVCGCVCDTMAIEEYTNQECSDLITDCVVVSGGRFSPTLIIEANTHDLDEAKVKAEVAIRLAAFNERLYRYERIKSTHIIVVETGTLPRTGKGNIPRSVVENQFKGQLDELDLK
ncbi:acetyl-CoA synthetase-like protein [Hysterangium stoloniferum]|nr:acetyl-CoA synthetase-like protein [Hysterangium stoloniferum]